MPSSQSSGISETEALAAHWSHAEFGDAKLGNALRTNRLVQIAGEAAQHPAGFITAVLTTSAEQEGAYRFMENAAIRPGAMSAAAAQACARRAKGHPIIIAATDGSSLTFSDPSGARKMGSIGPRSKGGRGVKVMSTLGITLDGTPLGLLGQVYWRRGLEPNKVPAQRRPFGERETRHWVDLMRRGERICQQEAPDTVVWFQGDCEADFKEVLEYAKSAPANVWVTVRNGRDRLVSVQDHGCRKLWDAADGLPLLGKMSLQISGSSGCAARTAEMEVRGGNVTLTPSANSGGENKTGIRMGVVWTREVSPVPHDEEPIEWLLLTTAPVDSFEDACLVIHAYSLRWRVEDFHRAWKSTCEIEDSQLEGPHVIRWAIILASVAVRIERLKHLARNEPDLPASVEFAHEEIAATILLRAPDGVDLETMPTVGQMVRWVADLGGYVHGRKRPPPGTVVIGRGLKRLEAAAELLRLQKVRRQT